MEILPVHSVSFQISLGLLLLGSVIPNSVHLRFCIFLSSVSLACFSSFVSQSENDGWQLDAFIWSGVIALVNLLYFVRMVQTYRLEDPTLDADRESLYQQLFGEHSPLHISKRDFVSIFGAKSDYQRRRNSLYSDLTSHSQSEAPCQDFSYPKESILGEPLMVCKRLSLIVSGTVHAYRPFLQNAANYCMKCHSLRPTPLRQPIANRCDSPLPSTTLTPPLSAPLSATSMSNSAASASICTCGNPLISSSSFPRSLGVATHANVSELVNVIGQFQFIDSAEYASHSSSFGSILEVKLVSMSDVRLVSWSYERLDSILSKAPHLKKIFHTLILHDLAKQLFQNNQTISEAKIIRSKLKLFAGNSGGAAFLGREEDKDLDKNALKSIPSSAPAFSKASLLSLSDSPNIPQQLPQSIGNDFSLQTANEDEKRRPLLADMRKNKNYTQQNTEDTL